MYPQGFSINLSHCLFVCYVTCRCQPQKCQLFWLIACILFIQVIIIIINQFYLKSKHASLAQLKADLQEGRDIYNSRIYGILYEPPNLPPTTNSSPGIDSRSSISSPGIDN